MGLAIIVPNISFDDVNLGKVTISGNIPIRGLSINLEDYYVGTTVNLKCSYLPANTTQRNVVWSIESGSEYASLSGSVLTILQGARHSEVTIKGTSSSNPTLIAEKTITVTYSQSGFVDEGYFNANILSDGTIEEKSSPACILSTAKRRVDSKNISIKIAGGTGINISENNQIKVVEYDSKNNFIRRQVELSIRGDKINNFELSENTTYIIICVQIASVNSEALNKLDVAKNVYSSIEFTGVVDTEIDLTYFVDYE